MLWIFYFIWYILQDRLLKCSERISKRQKPSALMFRGVSKQFEKEMNMYYSNIKNIISGGCINIVRSA